MPKTNFSREIAFHLVWLDFAVELEQICEYLWNFVKFAILRLAGLVDGIIV